MVENDNPSVVNDASGNNFGGINDYTGNALQESQLQYLDNLSRLAQKMPPKDISNADFFPSANRGIQVGSVGTKTLGNVPIFAAGTGLFPFAAMNEMKRARSEAEALYYQKMKAETDKPLFDQKLQLSDPWRQPAFSQKVMDTVDSYLALYAEKFGGDMGKAYVATKNDPNFRKTVQSYADYVNMYNTVYNKALKLEQDRNDAKTGMDVYVSPDGMKTVNRFLYSHEDLTNLKPDELLNEAKKANSTFSAISLATSLTAGYKDQVKQTDFAKSDSLSNNELDTLISRKKTNEGAAEQIIKDGLAAYPWLNTDPEQKAVFEREIRNRVAYSEELVVKEIKKENADRNLALQRLGWADDKGDVKFQDKPSALVNAKGEYAISYPQGGKPISTPVGMKAFVVNNGRLRYVELPESYDMNPASEYDITQEGSGLMRGRYIEGKVTFQSSQPYTPQLVRTASSQGQITDAQVIGEGKTTAQVAPVKARDVYTNEEVQLFGETTIMTPYDNLKTTMEATLPNLGFVHEQLDKITYPGGERRNFSLGNQNSPTTVQLTDSMTIDDIKPDLMYSKDGKTISGQELINKYNASQNK